MITIIIPVPHSKHPSVSIIITISSALSLILKKYLKQIQIHVHNVYELNINTVPQKLKL